MSEAKDGRELKEMLNKLKKNKKLTLREKQSKFASLIPILILYAYSQGYEITFGDAWANTGHIRGSFHYKRLAIDLNLFKNGRYLARTEDHKLLGKFWKSLDKECTWGGDFTNQRDGDHYSYGEN